MHHCPLRTAHCRRPLPAAYCPLLPLDAAQVKVARSQNKTRRHGLGNHWVTGHQRLIKHYKNVRLMALELVRLRRELGVYDVRLFGFTIYGFF